MAKSFAMLNILCIDRTIFLLKKLQSSCPSYYKKMWQPQNFPPGPDAKVMQLLLAHLAQRKLHSKDSRKANYKRQYKLALPYHFISCILILFSVTLWKCSLHTQSVFSYFQYVALDFTAVSLPMAICNTKAQSGHSQSRPFLLIFFCIYVLLYHCLYKPYWNSVMRISMHNMSRTRCVKIIVKEWSVKIFLQWFVGEFLDFAGTSLKR